MNTKFAKFSWSLLLIRESILTVLAYKKGPARFVVVDAWGNHNTSLRSTTRRARIRRQAGFGVRVADLSARAVRGASDRASTPIGHVSGALRCATCLRRRLWRAAGFGARVADLSARAARRASDRASTSIGHVSGALQCTTCLRRRLWGAC
jgi:hypothetical protein